MKRLGMTAVLVLLAATASAQVTSVDQIKTPPLRKFENVQPKRIALPNGLVIFLQEDHELPLIKGRATIRGGARDVSADKAGLLGIYTGAWRTGGTAAKTGDQLDDLLDARAARVETGGSTDATFVSLDTLKADFDTVFPIFVDVLRQPQFRQDKIDLAKTQANTGISRRNDEPGGIAGREAQKLGYGASSPYARQPEYATIASITRDDLVAFHARTVHPNNIILSFIGDFNAPQLEKRLRDTFGSWNRGPQVAKPTIAMNGAKPGLYFVAKDDVTQATIAMVHPGIERNNPDYYALNVMNEIFGGGFSGRLMQTLRSQKGLTYGVGGGVGANWDYPGLFRVQMATKSGTTLESIEALKAEVSRLVSAPITAEEMSLAKESILNAFVFTMDTRDKALNQQVLLELYGFPNDYFAKYPSMIEKVTAADVQRVAKTYVHPDQLAVLVVGNEKEFEKPLSSLGTVTPIDVTIPEPGSSPEQSKSAAPATSNNEGLALVNKVVDFVGGRAAIDAVQAMRRAGTMSMNTQQGAMEGQVDSLTNYAAMSQRAVMNLPMGEITRVVTPAAGFVLTPMGTQDLPGSARDAALSELRADLLNVLKNVGNVKYTFTTAPNETVAGIDARVLEVNADGAVAKWYLEPSGRLIRSVTHAGAPMPGDIVTDFSDWKAFSGITLPTHAVITRNGEPAGELKLATVELNPAVDAKAFVKP
jgi:zinc protease